MSFLLDTDICSAVVREDRKVMGPYMQYTGRLFTSRIVMVELYDWAHGSKKPQKRWESIAKLLEEVRVLEFDEPAAQECGKLRYSLRKKGTVVGDMDLLIGSTALARGLTLVTHNVKDFEKIPGLGIEDWLA